MTPTASPRSLLRGVGFGVGEFLLTGTYRVAPFPLRTGGAHPLRGDRSGVPLTREMLVAARHITDLGHGIQEAPADPDPLTFTAFTLQVEGSRYWGKPGTLVRPPRTAIIIDPEYFPDDPAGNGWARRGEFLAAAPALAARGIYLCVVNPVNDQLSQCPATVPALALDFGEAATPVGGSTVHQLLVTRHAGALAGGQLYVAAIGNTNCSVGPITDLRLGGDVTGGYSGIADDTTLTPFADKIAADAAVLAAVGPGYDRLAVRFWITPDPLVTTSDNGVPVTVATPINAEILAGLPAAYVAVREGPADGSAGMGTAVVADMLAFFGP